MKIKEVMKFYNPRMLIYHPIIAIRHLIENKKYTTYYKYKNRILKIPKECATIYVNNYTAEQT